MKLTNEQIQTYRNDGYLIIPNLLSEKELNILNAEADVLMTSERYYSDANVYEKNGAPRVSYSPHKDSDAFAALPCLPRILEPVEQLVGGKVYLFQARLNPKVAGHGDQFQWHQDFASWIHDGFPADSHDQMISIGVMLDETDETNGCLHFIPGSHKKGLGDFFLDEGTTSYASYCFTEDYVKKEVDESKAIDIVGPAGTVVFFSPLIFHSSSHNHSDKDRCTMYYVFNKITNRPSLPITRTYAYPMVTNDNLTQLRPTDDQALLELA